MQNTRGLQMILPEPWASKNQCTQFGSKSGCWSLCINKSKSGSNCPIKGLPPLSKDSSVFLSLSLLECVVKAPLSD